MTDENEYKIYETAQEDKLIIPVEAEPESPEFESSVAGAVDVSRDSVAIYTGRIISSDEYDVSDFRAVAENVRNALVGVEEVMDEVREQE